MAMYIQFDTGNEDDGTVLVELDSGEDVEAGFEEASRLGKTVEGVVKIAEETLSASVNKAIQSSIQPMLNAVRNLPEEPSEIEITFGLKAIGEVGNMAVGKAGGEANYIVKLTWKQPSNQVTQNAG